MQKFKLLKWRVFHSLYLYVHKKNWQTTIKNWVGHIKIGWLGQRNDDNNDDDIDYDGYDDDEEQKKQIFTFQYVQNQKKINCTCKSIRCEIIMKIILGTNCSTLPSRPFFYRPVWVIYGSQDSNKSNMSTNLLMGWVDGWLTAPTHFL